MALNVVKAEEPDKEPELLSHLNNEVPQDHRETVKVKSFSEVKLEDGKENEIVEQEPV